MKFLILVTAIIVSSQVLASSGDCSRVLHDQLLNDESDLRIKFSLRQRLGYEVKSFNGKIYDINGDPIHTRRFLGFKFSPFIIQKIEGEVRILGVEFDDHRFVDHGNLANYEPVLSAGYWRVDNGKIKKLRIGSKYYELSEAQKEYALKMFSDLLLIRRN